MINHDSFIYVLNQKFHFIFRYWRSDIILPFIVIPLLLTIFNTNFLLKKLDRVFLINFTIVYAFFCTSLYIIAYTNFNSVIAYEYKTSFYYLKNVLEYNKFNYLPLFFLGMASLFILNTFKRNFPPIITILLMSFVYIFNILTIFLSLQIKVSDSWYYIIYLVPYNSIIITIMVFRKIINRQLEYVDQNKITYKNPILNKCYIFLCNSKNWGVISFAILMLLFFVNVAIYIITLFGQGDTTQLNNLLDVNKWLTINEVMITPPPEPEPEIGHYLCTVALKGDVKVVKPLRYGYRHKNKIIVNRQLLVANAFEDYIKEKVPKFHKFIRYIYDKYGYPLSKHIKTKRAANITYILMKPLEWFFVLFLYTFDSNPEKRISRQYL